MKRVNNQFLLQIKKHTDTLFEQTKTKQQETLELKLNKQMDTSSTSPPFNMIDEGIYFFRSNSFGGNQLRF